jgi:hypothetical protein
MDNQSLRYTFPNKISSFKRQIAMTNLLEESPKWINEIKLGHLGWSFLFITVSVYGHMGILIVANFQFKYRGFGG